MGLQERHEAIRRLQEVRGSKVLVHFLSDRRIAQGIPISGMTTLFAGEAYPLIYEHLRALGKSEKLDLFLHTSGGHLDGVWPIVQILRAMTEKFSVIVPMRALSAGTLVCLGADEVVMGEAAHLSSTDPSTTNPFNPKEQDAPIPISVQDVTSYFDLARGEEADEEIGTGFGLKSDEHILQVFKELTRTVHPLALGNVKRAHSQIRTVSKRLLQLHVKGEDAEEQIKRVVTTLTEGLFSHGHLIGRAEAADILGEDMVVSPSEEEAAAMGELYVHYEELFELKRTFNIKEWLGDADEQELETIGGVVESERMSHVFKAMSKVRKISDLPQGVQLQVAPGQRMPIIPGLPTKINIEPIRQGWYTNEQEV